MQIINKTKCIAYSRVAARISLACFTATAAAQYDNLIEILAKIDFCFNNSYRFFFRKLWFLKKSMDWFINDLLKKHR